MSKKKYTPRHKAKESRSSRILPWLLLLLVFVLAAVGGAIFASTSLFDDPHARRNDVKINNSAEPLLVAKDKATVMIMGVDERADDIGRSDTLMLATVDPKKKQASLLSIPRDTRCIIPGYGYDKINAAYALGGWKLSRDAVEELLDTHVDHYVKINTRSFPRIIDAIGGIDIDVEDRMEYTDEWDDAVPGGLVIDLYPGMQHMDGVTAMSYVRYRDEEGDIGRIARQQKFMRAVIDKVMSPSIIIRLPSIIRETLASVETDLSFRELAELAGALKESQSNGLKTAMVKGYPLYIDGISYWIPDIGETRSSFASTLGISMNAAARSEIERDRADMESSIPDTAVEVPESDTSIGRLSRERDSGAYSRPTPLTKPSASQDTTRRDSTASSSDSDTSTTTTATDARTSRSSSDTTAAQDTSTDTDDASDGGYVPPHTTVPRPTVPTAPTAPSSPSAPSASAGGKGQ
ncbi:MAG: LCP family protein [Selenomonadaceae bacterium]